MVHTNVVSAAVAATRNSPRSRPPVRLSSDLSFHAGAPIATAYSERQSLLSSSRRHSSSRYQTFPVPPPKAQSPGTSSAAHASSAEPSEDARGANRLGRKGRRRPSYRETRENEGNEDDGKAQLPWRQLGLLAILSLAEQTALNSISPYLPTMVSTFPSVPPASIGLYVGLLASAFALAQFATNLAWGYASDMVGRKPMLLLGTALLAACFAAFGFVRSFPAALVVHALMGALNGNAAILPTCMGEITNRHTQSRAFVWLPVIYSVGGITGPAVGGLLVGDVDTLAWPFLAPNLCAAAALLAAVVVLAIWFEETLEDADRKAEAAGTGWLSRFCRCGCCWRRGREGKGRKGSWSSRWPTRESAARSSTESTIDEDESSSIDQSPVARTDASTEHNTAERPVNSNHADEGVDAPTARPILKQLVNRTTITVLGTYLVFQLSNVSFNSLYPIFASTSPPTGRGLGPRTIGVSLSIAGLVTIVFQVFAYPPLRSRLGNLGSYRLALLGIAISMALMPWVGYPTPAETGQSWDIHGPVASASHGNMDWLVYIELGVPLILKNICAVSGLSSVFLLITNSAPSHETLGTLNGIAQTLSAGGRSVGPFLSGGLFTLSTRVRPKGELLAWWLFGGIALVGWMGTLAINGSKLESSEWDSSHDDSDEDSDEDDVGEGEGDNDVEAGVEAQRQHRHE